jgi:hypothetical protein
LLALFTTEETRASSGGYSGEECRTLRDGA